MSGRLSSCSVMQDEYLTKRMHKTPGTPIKMGYQTTPRKSDRKRSLFQPNSPTTSNSEDIGVMSPLSSSTCSSPESFESPHFSPNGKFTTPPRTPVNATPVRSSPRFSARKLEVKSTLFPNLNVHTPKSRTPKTPGSKHPRILSISRNSMFKKLLECDEIIKDLTTPPKLSGESDRHKAIIAETDSSPSTVVLTPVESAPKQVVHESPKPTILGIKPISSENFYGPVPQPVKARTCLFIDTLEPKFDENKKRIRSLSRESCLNRSFVSGSGGSGNRQRTSSNGSFKGHRSRSHQRRATIPGVWHSIKKPKKMKATVRIAKPLISPNSRAAKMLEPVNKKPKVEAKPRRLFEEKPRKRASREGSKKKRGLDDLEDEGIIDSFPDHRIKRKRLPSFPLSEPKQILQMQNITPDPSKKFMKHGSSRRATFTLNENVKLQIADGVMKLQTPKKRRKLYTRKDYNIDFDDDDINNGIDESVQNILNQLENDKDVTNTQKKQLRSPCKVQIQKITDAQLLGILESPSTKVGIVEATPSKTITEVSSSPNHKIVKNLSTLMIDEAEPAETWENQTSQSTKTTENGLETTGSIIAHSTKLLFDADMEAYPNSQHSADENRSPKDNLYSVFYKQNWNKSPKAISDITNTKYYSGKKKARVPDDQYLLDAGQKSIGIVTCPKCGVMYQAGDFADEATHNRFHNHLPELRFNGWNNERVVGKYPDGRVIMVLVIDPKAWWQKISKLVEIVDQELGFPEVAVNSLTSKTVYLYINEKSKQIAGCLIAEECKTAYKMFPPLEGFEVDSCSKDPTPCKVGISRIWTSLPHRRKGVASKLIECLQKTFCFAEIVPLDMIAFSVPSPSGKLLAQKVTGKMDFLVYGFA